MRKLFKICAPLVLAGVVNISCWGEVISAPLKQFLNADVIRQANVSVLIVTNGRGKNDGTKRDSVVADFRSTYPTPQASTMKVVTTATALEKYGPDYRFETKLEIDSNLDSDGVLHGNLYIVGGGDPSLGSSSAYVGDTNIVKKWATALYQRGIRRIKGGIVADASWADATAMVNPEWLWQDIGNGYGVPNFGLNYHDNKMTVSYRRGSNGKPVVVIGTSPTVNNLTWVNYTRCLSGRSLGDIDVNGLPLSEVRFLYGTIGTGTGVYKTGAALPNPPLTLAQELERWLKKYGISVEKEANCTLEPKSITSVRTVLYTHKSEPLSQIIKHTNRRSDNMYAEQLLLLNGKEKDTPATIDNGARAAKQYWGKVAPTIKRDFIVDGSGLSTKDALCARTLVDIMEYMRTGSKNTKVWMESLAVSGVWGTFAGFLNEGELKGKVYGKSGTTSRIKAYTGYVSYKGKNYTFAIIVNNQNGTTDAVKKQIETLIQETVVGR